MHTPILRSVAVLAIALPLTACVKSEIKPASEDAAPAPVAIETADSHDQTAPGQWRVLRVGGEPAHQVTVQPGETKAGEPAKYYEAGDARISAALPETFAPPTAPGAIDLKVYDTYRRAVIETEGGQNRAFWPLFQHISDRDIAMTAPVVMTGEMAGERADRSTMAFLYCDTRTGQTGEAEKDITVEDTTPTTVLATAFQGRDRDTTLAKMKQRLLGWLDEQPDEGPRWVVDGTPRLLGYNGPDRSASKRWWEYQIPVKWTGDERAPDA